MFSLTETDFEIFKNGEAIAQEVEGNLELPFSSELLYQGNLAAVSAWDISWVKVFYQLESGEIATRHYDIATKQWNDVFALAAVPVDAKYRPVIRTPLAAFQTSDGNIRLFYLSPSADDVTRYQLIEVVWEGTTAEGSEPKPVLIDGQPVTTAVYSNLGVTGYKTKEKDSDGNDVHLRVYYQETADKLNRLQELQYTPTSGWTYGPLLPYDQHRPLLGTSIAFIDHNSHDPNIRGYYQDVSGTIREVLYYTEDDKNWIWGHFKKFDKVPFRTPITAIDPLNKLYQCIFWVDNYNRLVHSRWTQHGWEDPVAKGKVDRVPLAPGSKLAVAGVYAADAEDHYDLYLFSVLPLNTLTVRKFNSSNGGLPELVPIGDSVEGVVVGTKDE
ncbi:hypothetical protein TWF225_011022 [Orbilia oligospora]|uniref:Uncharacterized protein n=1 Tax=Orbilia oligospora TaxID=2813651 RepID=A0A7C8K7T5_ORBOL|nr:hypothetical protein TWF751_009777 [Orbilia oligospora]KAF3193185.1 hypothetical protein TWF225_011022 [Orbilia oligospora]KAF3246533.1 hypothetical protein TWF217_009875 [Orbilia oligospora]KAF3271650.1 hypothetical protein TWF128_000213 [Orbilia oligospora]KAF3295138.1 hypothetical protein TWF132_002453 [Orbilia oligospora]